MIQQLKRLITGFNCLVEQQRHGMVGGWGWEGGSVCTVQHTAVKITVYRIRIKISSLHVHGKRIAVKAKPHDTLHVTVHILLQNMARFQTDWDIIYEFSQNFKGLLSVTKSQN